MPHRDLIVIGASAGGLQPLTDILGRLPTRALPAVTVTLRSPRLSREMAFRARTFPAQDGTSERVVLLTVAGAPATASGTA